MSTAKTETPPVIEIPQKPVGLTKAEWVPIREDWCTHLLDRAPEVETKGGMIWIRKTKNPEQLYVVLPKTQKWHCAKCGAAALSAQVAHPVWDGPFPCSGSGQCEYEDVPYCPTCETKPAFDGSPIRR
jgi:hypothetical protein